MPTRLYQDLSTCTSSSQNSYLLPSSNGHPTSWNLLVLVRQYTRQTVPFYYHYTTTATTTNLVMQLLLLLLLLLLQLLLLAQQQQQQQQQYHGPHSTLYAYLYLQLHKVVHHKQKSIQQYDTVVVVIVVVVVVVVVKELRYQGLY